MAYVITVNGCIGSGKSSVCEYLNIKYENILYFPERYEENPYIRKIYEYQKGHSDEDLRTNSEYKQMVYNCQRWSVMLANQNILNARAVTGNFIALVDVAPMYIVETFASVAHDKGYICESKKENLLLAALSTRKYITGNCILTANPKVLKERIDARKRDMESEVSLDYLTDLCFAAYSNFCNKNWRFLSTENRTVEEVAEELYEQLLVVVSEERRVKKLEAKQKAQFEVL